ncbi:hypothetical protein [Sphingomonas beigongshangi]|uniref:hypothetical protein n=1 Tax=Sphingomonas beigongshangi TaxID=2782540 RepID=UPI001EEF709D|nr:hypothetical protein [Sphingomonas beigongshangi]
MTDHVPIDAMRSRAPRNGIQAGVVILLALLAFVAGIGLAAYAMKRIAWFGGAPVQARRQAVAEPSGFSPSQPVNANDEGAAPDAAALASRQAMLAGQLSSIEARTATVTTEANAAAGQAARAEGVLVAVATRRALDRGTGLGYLEEQLRTRFGASQPRAVAEVIAAARQPVTLEDLRQGLDAIAPQIQTIGSSDLIVSLRQELGSLVVLRRADTPSPRPADRLARARRLLEGGQVEAARAEVLRMPGARNAGNWLSAAGRYVAARQALDRIETTALSMPAPTPVAPAPQPTAPAVTTDGV